MFGHAGPAMIAWAPVLSTIWAAMASPSMVAPGTVIRFRVEVDPVERVEVALQRVAQVLPAAGMGVERIAVVERLLRGGRG